MDKNTLDVIEKSKKYHQKYYEQLSNAGIPFFSLDQVFNRPHPMGEVFTRGQHFNHRANKAIAQVVYDHIEKPASIPEPHGDDTEITYCKNKAIQYLKTVAAEKYSTLKGMQEWLQEMKDQTATKLNVRGGGGGIGAIVMNCNPFTLGHRYLIETAAKMVDVLYVFVVQEDKSFFPFEDRIALVRQGIESIEGARIHVVPSGKFVISSFSFAGYFSKEQTVKPADSTVDVAIFGAIIAPALGITHRFVGEEPNCVTTNEYNDTMNFLLPDMGVQMHVIPRKNEQDAPISATTVRNCLRNNDFETIKRLVPETTYAYLQQFAASGRIPSPDATHA
jgi:[citrate (pro-3S)-lyase] ligase